jgi:outer membrane protein/adhesin transport system outer membrane protein
VRLALFLILVLAINFPAFAETFHLRKALAQAYETNPQIKKAIAELEAKNNDITRAYSGFLPKANAQLDYGRQRNAIGGTNFEYSKANTQSLSIIQPLFQGGETIAQVDKADYEIEVARFNLQLVEQNVLLNTVAAYTAYITAQALLDLAENNYKLLERQLELTDARFELGELTKTDVAQAQARLAAVAAEKISARTAVISSRASYQQIIGQEPENLAFPTDIPPTPKTLEKALELGKKFNPELQSTIFAQKAAEENIDISIAQILPSADLVGSMRRDKNSGFLNGNFDSDSVLLQLSIPLFQGGAEYANIRQAKKTSQAQNFAITDITRKTEQQIRSAWEEASSAKAAIEANEAAVKAAETAFEGINEEQKYGLRNVLDVLDSEQTLFNTKNNLLLAKRDQIIAYYSLLDKMGLLTAQNLELSTKIYDSEQSYDDTKFEFIGF